MENWQMDILLSDGPGGYLPYRQIFEMVGGKGQRRRIACPRLEQARLLAFAYLWLSA